MKLEDANKLTLQEACDYAVSKIVEQGERCLSSTDSCVYGNEKGQHCAVGWLLDETNPELMDFVGSVGSLTDYLDSGRVLEVIPKVIVENENLFRYLQNFHDSRIGADRQVALEYLSLHIDTSAPQYQQWVNMV